MKQIIIVVLVLCVLTTNAFIQVTFSELTQIWQRFLLKHIDECVGKTKVDRVLAERLLPYGEYIEDPKLKCFAKCIGEKLHMVETDAKTHVQNFLDVSNIHDPVIRRDIIIQCFEQIMNEDECSQVFYTSKCAYFIVKNALAGKENKKEL